MENIIKKITEKYGTQIEQVDQVGSAELSIQLKKEVNPTHFAQHLKDDLLTIIDDFSILKINIIDTNGSLTDSFSSNQ